jgi:RNA polymerase sigma factor (sigma-70 family)
MGKETLNCRAMAYSADLIIKTELYSKEEKKEVNYSSNDLDIIQSLYDEYANDLLLYGLKMGYNRDILEDAIHDIFYRMCRSPHRLRKIEKLKIYLFSALKNQLVNIHKAASKNTTTDIQEFNFSVEIDSLHILIEKEERIQIKEKINRLLEVLSDKQREIIYLRFFQELSYDEIGVMLNMTPASVKNVVYKAINKIRK